MYVTVKLSRYQGAQCRDQPPYYRVLVCVVIIAALAVRSCQAYTVYPSQGGWVCNVGETLWNQTLSGGIQSGEFKKVGFVSNMETCKHYCCNDAKCDVALVAKDTCYLVSCDNEVLCHPVRAQATDLHPQIAFVTRNLFSGRSISGVTGAEENKGQTVVSFFKKGPRYPNPSQDYGSEHPRNNAIINPFGSTASNFVQMRLNSRTPLSELESGDQKRVLIQGSKYKIKSKAEEFFSQQDTTPAHMNSEPKALKNLNVLAPSTCYPSQTHHKVSLKYGPDSGDFYDYGEIGNMKLCVELCCKDKVCDVAFMVGITCYAISCYTLEKCVMISASPKAKLSSQLAYVVKRSDKEADIKLQVIRGHEMAYEKITGLSERRAQKNIVGKEHKSYTLNKFSELSPDEPNVPMKLTRHCRRTRVEHNYALVGGQRAGVYTFRGITPGFEACINLCCADLFCDAAFQLARRCYSVQCYKNGKCSGRPAKTRNMHSMLSFIERSDLVDVSAKRTSIPGLLPTDRQYTVWLNVTNEDYKEELRDPESLEFLNFAEGLRSAISALYGNVDGFRYVEVLHFKPNKVIAVFNLTVDESTSAKVILQRLVDAIRKGELKNYDEPVSGHLVLDVRGFQFKNSKGQSLICSPEFNYDVHWPLAMFGTSVNIPCPRKARGLCTRHCRSYRDRTVHWSTPDFSDCISGKYEALLKEAQLLTTSSIHSPELTSASIIDRLLQMSTIDTYGTHPPQPIPAISYDLAGDSDFHGALTGIAPEILSERNKERIPDEKLKAFLHTMGLSSLLTKSGHMDLSSLYKSLSSTIKGGHLDLSHEVSRMAPKQAKLISQPPLSDSELHSKNVKPAAWLKPNVVLVDRVSEQHLPKHFPQNSKFTNSVPTISLRHRQQSAMIQETSATWSKPRPLDGSTPPVKASASLLAKERFDPLSKLPSNVKGVGASNLIKVRQPAARNSIASEHLNYAPFDGKRNNLENSLYPDDTNRDYLAAFSPTTNSNGWPLYEDQRTSMERPFYEKKGATTPDEMNYNFSIRKRRQTPDSYSDEENTSRTEHKSFHQNKDFSKILSQLLDADRRKRYTKRPRYLTNERSVEGHASQLLDDAFDFKLTANSLLTKRSVNSDNNNNTHDNIKTFIPLDKVAHPASRSKKFMTPFKRLEAIVRKRQLVNQPRLANMTQSTLVFDLESVGAKNSGLESERRATDLKNNGEGIELKESRLGKAMEWPLTSLVARHGKDARQTGLPIDYSAPPVQMAVQRRKWKNIKHAEANDDQEQPFSLANTHAKANTLIANWQLDQPVNADSFSQSTPTVDQIADQQQVLANFRHGPVPIAGDDLGKVVSGQWLSHGAGVIRHWLKQHSTEIPEKEKQLDSFGASLNKNANRVIADWQSDHLYVGKGDASAQGADLSYTRRYDPTDTITLKTMSENIRGDRDSSYKTTTKRSSSKAVNPVAALEDLDQLSDRQNLNNMKRRRESDGSIDDSEELTRILGNTALLEEWMDIKHAEANDNSAQRFSLANTHAQANTLIAHWQLDQPVNIDSFSQSTPTVDQTPDRQQILANFRHAPVPIAGDDLGKVVSGQWLSHDTGVISNWLKQHSKEIPKEEKQLNSFRASLNKNAIQVIADWQSDHLYMGKGDASSRSAHGSDLSYKRRYDPANAITPKTMSENKRSTKRSSSETLNPVAALEDLDQLSFYQDFKNMKRRRESDGSVDDAEEMTHLLGNAVLTEESEGDPDKQSEEFFGRSEIEGMEDQNKTDGVSLVENFDYKPTEQNYLDAHVQDGTSQESEENLDLKEFPNTKTTMRVSAPNPAPSESKFVSERVFQPPVIVDAATGKQVHPSPKHSQTSLHQSDVHSMNSPVYGTSFDVHKEEDGRRVAFNQAHLNAPGVQVLSETEIKESGTHNHGILHRAHAQSQVVLVNGRESSKLAPNEKQFGRPVQAHHENEEPPTLIPLTPTVKVTKLKLVATTHSKTISSTAPAPTATTDGTTTAHHSNVTAPKSAKPQHHQPALPLASPAEETRHGHEVPRYGHEISLLVYNATKMAIDGKKDLNEEKATDQEKPDGGRTHSKWSSNQAESSLIKNKGFLHRGHNFEKEANVNELHGLEDLIPSQISYYPRASNNEHGDGHQGNEHSSALPGNSKIMGAIDEDDLNENTRLQNFKGDDINVKGLTVEQKPNELIYTYEKQEGKIRAPMFGGDILLAIDIADELEKHILEQDQAPSLQEVEEFLQMASALVDAVNEREWKHAARRMKILDKELQAQNINTNELDQQDWRVLHGHKSGERYNILLNFVDTVVSYGKQVAHLYSIYNPRLKDAIFTKNIVMQIKILKVENLLGEGESSKSYIRFPDYKSDERFSSWGSTIEQISFPISEINTQYDERGVIHMSFFRFKSIAGLQRFPSDQDELDEKDIVDESPIKVATDLLSMAIDPQLTRRTKMPVSMTFANTYPEQENLPHRCSYWNESKNLWSAEGCRLVAVNRTHTTCECSHVATFGVVVDTSESKPTHFTPLKVEQPTEPPAIASTQPAKAPTQPLQPLPQAPAPTEQIKIEPKTEPKMEPKTTETTTEQKTTTTAGTTPPTGEPKPTPSKEAYKEQKHDHTWFWIILLVLLLLLLLLLLLICIWYCCCRKKRESRPEPEPKSQESDPSALETAVGSDNLIDKSKLKEDPRKGRISPGSNSSSKTSSPEPSQSPGWRKLLSNANHPESLLLKEKALLFSDYHQPYHFLSQEKQAPDTSVESIYGSTAPPSLRHSSQRSSSQSSKRRRSYEPKHRRSPRPSVEDSENRPKQLTPETSPESAKREITPKIARDRTSIDSSLDKSRPTALPPRSKEEEIVPSVLTEATSMEWDPYMEQQQKAKDKKILLDKSKAKRNISPIDEEEEDPNRRTYTDSQSRKSDFDSPVSSTSDTSYPESAGTESAGSKTKSSGGESSGNTPPTTRRSGKTRTPSAKPGDTDHLDHRPDPSRDYQPK